MPPPAAPAAALLGAAALLLVCRTAAAPASAISAGDVFHICKRSDPQLGECIKRSIQELLPKMANGIPEIKIPKHEPLFVPKITIKQGDGPVSLDSTFTNQNIHGISKVKILSAGADLDKNELRMEFSVPELYFEGNYSIDGRILLVPMKGHGFGTTNYTGVSGTAVLRGHRETRGGKEFLEIDEAKFDMQVKGAKNVLDNLFPGDKAVEATLARVLEDNWELLFAELKPVVDESIGAIVRQTANRVFQRFPLDELFPQ